MSCLSRAVRAVFLGAAVAGASSIACDAHDAARCECDGKPLGPDTWTPPPWMSSNASSLWDVTEMMDGKATPLANFKAKAALVVNVASA